jgi:NADH-quinone oxidoreductase subunit H
VKRFVGMTLTLAALVGFLILLSAGFYWVAAGFGWACNWLSIAFGWNSPGTLSPFAFHVGITLGNLLTLMMVVLMISGSLLTVAERKWSALLQNRIGANRITVGGNPLGGIPYLLADALKMLTKERAAPDVRTRLLFDLAPVLAFAPVFCLFAIVPVGPPLDLGAFFGGAVGVGRTVALQVAQIDAGLLYLFAIASLSVYGTSLAGWASNNKLALLGGVRASSQMISYEVSMGLSLVGTMMAYRTLRLEEMVVAQGAPVLGGFPALGLLLQPIGFLIFFTSGFAETKRAPFDLPEGESEIVGYFIEYSGMKFGMMFLAEFLEIAVFAGVITAIFLGGWHPLVVNTEWLRAHVTPIWFGAIGAGAFLAKMIVLMWLQLVIRWLLPRFRYDQVQKLCWKILLPAALVNIFVTGAAILIDPSLQLLAWIGLATIIVIGVLVGVTGRSASAHDASPVHGGHGTAPAAGH